MSRSGFTRAQLQEDALFISRQNLFKQIQEIRTKLRNLDTQIEPLTNEVKLANIKNLI